VLWYSAAGSAVVIPTVLWYSTAGSAVVIPTVLRYSTNSLFNESKNFN